MKRPKAKCQCYNCLQYRLNGKEYKPHNESSILPPVRPKVRVIKDHSIQGLTYISALLLVILFIWILGSGCTQEIEQPSIDEVVRNHVGWLSQQTGVISVQSFQTEDGEDLVEITFDDRFDSYTHLLVELDGYRVKVTVK